MRIARSPTREAALAGAWPRSRGGHRQTRGSARDVRRHRRAGACTTRRSGRGGGQRHVAQERPARLRSGARPCRYREVERLGSARCATTVAIRAGTGRHEGDFTSERRRRGPRGPCTGGPLSVPPPIQGVAGRGRHRRGGGRRRAAGAGWRDRREGRDRRFVVVAGKASASRSSLVPRTQHVEVAPA